MTFRAIVIDKVEGAQTSVIETLGDEPPATAHVKYTGHQEGQQEDPGELPGHDPFEQAGRHRYQARAGQ